MQNKNPKNMRKKKRKSMLNATRLWLNCVKIFVQSSWKRTLSFQDLLLTWK